MQDGVPVASFESMQVLADTVRFVEEIEIEPQAGAARIGLVDIVNGMRREQVVAHHGLYPSAQFRPRRADRQRSEARLTKQGSQRWTKQVGLRRRHAESSYGFPSRARCRA